MARKQECRKCGKWFTNKLSIDGMYWVPPADYDPSLCDNCNSEISLNERPTYASKSNLA